MVASPITPQPPAPEANLGAAWVLLWRRLGVKVALALGLLALTAVGYLVGVKSRSKAASASGYAAGQASVTPAVRQRYIASQKHVGEQMEMASAGLRPDRFADGEGSYFAIYFTSTYQDTYFWAGRDDTVWTQKRPRFTVLSRMLGGRWYWVDSRGTLHHSER